MSSPLYLIYLLSGAHTNSLHFIHCHLGRWRTDPEDPTSKSCGVCTGTTMHCTALDICPVTMHAISRGLPSTINIGNTLFYFNSSINLHCMSFSHIIPFTVHPSTNVVSTNVVFSSLSHSTRVLKK